jgi:hypothetical protein
MAAEKTRTVVNEMLCVHAMDVDEAGRETRRANLSFFKSALPTHSSTRTTAQLPYISALGTAAMSVVPSSSAKKGEVVLQPAFFTSSLYVHPLREDISALAPAYFEAWTRAPTREKPFTIFKQVWSGIGWPWLHFKTLEDRSRDRFSDITMRLFLGMSMIRCHSIPDHMLS